MKTIKGWVVKSSSTQYWADTKSNLSYERREAFVFSTFLKAEAARNAVCSKGCCQIFRVTSRSRPK